MSTLIAYILPQGIIFAADKNITVTPAGGGPSYQKKGAKILRWPSSDALVGYVGLARVGWRPMSKWLEGFIKRHPTVADPNFIAHELQSEIQAAVGGARKPLIIQFAAFAKHGGVMISEYWHIANIHGMDEETGAYDPPKSFFGCSEELSTKLLKSMAASNIRADLATRAKSYDPRWFHQSIGLVNFNVLEAAAKAGIRALQSAGFLPAPATLDDWEKHARFWILQYGAYYSAFYPPGKQYVGGGADALSIPWPP